MEIQSKHSHSEGRCSIIPAVSSDCIFTVGEDSRVLFFQMIKMKIIKHIFQTGKVESSDVSSLTFEPIHCVSSKTREHCYIACNDNVIRACKLDSFEFVQVIMKTTQPIQWIAISHDSAFL